LARHNLIGPSLIAVVTDHVFGDPKMVGYSLQIVTSTASVVAAALLFAVLPSYVTIVRTKS
jgi:hypothetical protein